MVKMVRETCVECETLHAFSARSFTYVAAERRGYQVLTLDENVF